MDACKNKGSSPNKPARMTIIDAAGVAHEGVSIRGAVPILTRHGRVEVETMIRRATHGKYCIYEPRPGHVRAYISGPDGDHDERLIDLRCAVLTVWEQED